MRNMLFSVVLFSIAHLAFAECIPDAPPKASQVQAGSQWLTASADDSPVMRDAPVMRKTVGRDTASGASTMQTVAHPNAAATPVMPEILPSDEPRPRAKTAMLIAAVAVMLTIALRRAGASDR